MYLWDGEWESISEWSGGEKTDFGKSYDKKSMGEILGYRKFLIYKELL